jgi:hypothetical protein
MALSSVFALLAASIWSLWTAFVSAGHRLRHQACTFVLELGNREHAEEKQVPLHGSMNSSWMSGRDGEKEDPSLQAFKSTVSWSSKYSNGNGRRRNLVRKKARLRRK